MAKKTELEGYSVIVFLPSSPYRDKKAQHDDARTVRDEIARHVDGVEMRNIDIEPQIDVTCEFCGMRWTENDDQYNGGCCASDEEAHERDQAADRVDAAHTTHEMQRGER